jgi:homoaconitase/3-isopropylmalate dehydratase large subunit
MNLLGVFGSLATGVGTTDIVATLATGKLWFKVPHTHRYVVDGDIHPPVTAKDVILRILKEIGTDGARYRAVEFSGSSIEKMRLPARITLTSMITEMSGMIGFVEPDESILGFLRGRTDSGVDPISADPDAHYERTFHFDVSGLEPQVACPHSPDNVRAVADVAGTRIDQVFIGSCTNGRAEDLKLAAELLKGRRAKTRLIVVPATLEVAKELVESGAHEFFLDAGAVVTNPSCALCTHGHPGILASGETMVSTSNRNFVGKLGSGAEVYLASPATAAASAITGVITDPREL